jgi:hypothetical protein
MCHLKVIVVAIVIADDRQTVCPDGDGRMLTYLIRCIV